MLIIPAIDIRKGSCVRLVRGDPQQSVTYSADPVQMAKVWEQKGATRIHVVDLDGAFDGKPAHLDLAGQIKREVKCEIELGGGLRSRESVEKALGFEIDKIILGTIVFENPTWIKELMSVYRERFIVALDVKDGRVATKGWKASSGVKLDDALKEMESLGFLETIYTDTTKDGVLEGPNLIAVQNVVSGTKMGVYASGGVSSLNDIKKLKQIKGLNGMIIGKALYENRFTLEDALAES